MDRRIELQQSTESSVLSGKNTLRILPCRIDYDGPCDARDLQEVTISSTSAGTDGAEVTEAYLRGRRLHGEQILPGYTAHVYDASDRGVTRPVRDPRHGEEDQDDEGEHGGPVELEEVKVWRETSRCDRIIAYGNGAAPTATMQAIRDWVAAAECIHSS